MMPERPGFVRSPAAAASATMPTPTPTPTPTRTAEGIRRHGFRKWYERPLVESHLFLVTAVLALVATLAWFSWRRYAALRMLAEHVGHQAQCPACGRHGFRALPPGDCEVCGRPDSLVASCRRCGHRWPIDTGG
jgi:hypothetical protein